MLLNGNGLKRRGEKKKGGNKKRVRGNLAGLAKSLIWWYSVQAGSLECAKRE